ncbi:unnamed protein product [Pelagomonas calceolata]|uniref:FHA domain-containing protein n=1 Tax=Pelagomonas calceolata TaxID=35677 RepID=A0A8J2SHY3_9STRA|nr:unnamed protein product [Pelagomonas calceolata]
MPIFAKIQGKTLYADNDDDEELPDINLDITHTKVFLGRADAYPADESLGPHMGTCHSKSVSRRHLTISWDPDRDQWQLYVDSKNGVVVDTKFWEKGKTVDLFHKSAIKFGPCACYFVLPGGEGEPVIAASTVAAPPPPPPPPPVAVPPPLFVPPPPEPTSVVVQSGGETKPAGPTYAELVALAFAAPELGRPEGVETKEIREWILGSVPEWGNATAAQKKLLAGGIQGVLSRGAEYVKAESAGRKNRWLRQNVVPPPPPPPPPPPDSQTQG